MANESFSDRLRLAIGDQSVNSFALAAGIPQSVMRKYLSGSLPRLDNLVALARAAAVSLTWLATGEGEMRPGTAEATPLVDAGLHDLHSWLRQWWSQASLDQRGWLRVEIARLVPDFAEWQKKQVEQGKKSKAR